MVDEQPRWPAGTPIAPGGHGPGGGRWMRVKGADLPGLVPGGGGMWLLRQTLGMGAVQQFDRADVPDRPDLSTGLTHHGGLVTNIRPDQEVEISPVEPDTWVSRVVASLPAGSHLQSHMLQPAAPDAQVGTRHQLLAELERGNQVEALRPNYGGDEWRPVVRAEVHTGPHITAALPGGPPQRLVVGPIPTIYAASRRGGVEYPEPIRDGAIQYRVVGQGQTPIVRFDSVAYPGLPEGPDKRREEAMYALGGLNRNHPIQVEAMLAAVGMPHEDSDVTAALGNPQVRQSEMGLNYDLTWEDMGRILNGELEQALESGRMDLGQYIKVYDRVKRDPRPEAQAMLHALELGVDSTVAQEQFLDMVGHVMLTERHMDQDEVDDLIDRWAEDSSLEDWQRYFRLGGRRGVNEFINQMLAGDAEEND